MTDRDRYGAVIVGAGPAGSSLAIRLALADRRVLLVDKSCFPRDKVCGEYISAECTKHFAELGVNSLIESIGATAITETAFYTRGGRHFAVPSDWFGGRVALGLSRAEMDTALVQRARDLGVHVIENGRMVEALPDGTALIRINERAEIRLRADLFVDATGRTRSLSKLIAPTRTRESKPTHIAFKAHVRDAGILPTRCEIYGYSGGYGGCNRIELDKYNLCYIASARDARRLSSNPEHLLRSVVFENAQAQRSLSEAKICSPWLAVPITRYGRGIPAPCQNLIAIGDAAAFIDPFTGSGMLMAFEGARIAAEAIASTTSFEELAPAYSAAHSAAFDRRLRFSSALRYAAYSPTMGELLAILLSGSSSISERVARGTRFNAEPRA